MIESSSHQEEEKHFVEFRRKVRSAEILSASMQRLLEDLRFTGRLSIVIQNGQVLKSGYEEGYFQRLNACQRRAAVSWRHTTK